MEGGGEFTVEVGTRVLVHGKYTGVIRYVPERRSALVGVELTRARGDNDGVTEDGQRLFECKPLHGVFVREEHLSAFSEADRAACVVQSSWRRYTACQRFRHLFLSHAWNVLDNTQEQLNLKRSEEFKSAEYTLAQLSKKKHVTRTVSDIAISEIPIDADYTGPHVVWPLELSNVLAILESFKTTTLLHYKYVLELLKEGTRSFSPLPTLQDISLTEGETLTVVGDLHGQLQDLFTIFSMHGLPSPRTKYFFNGDFVDRGLYGTEVVLTLVLFRLLYPCSVFLNRGNHESRTQNAWMGFQDEVYAKYSGADEADYDRPRRVYDAFQNLFDALPLCAVVQEKIFIVHGGLFSRDHVTLAELRSIARHREPPLHQATREDQLFEELLWSDPRLVASRQASERGAGVEFGVHVTNHFCLENHLALILRSHECVLEGYEILHGGRLITLFSASRYCGTQMNKGAFLTLGPELEPAIQQFYAHAMHESTFGLPAGHQDATAHDVLEDETLRMLAERICDAKAALYWYFTQHELERDGTVPRCVWADALRTVLQLDLPFLTYQAKLADVVAQDPTRINYSQFLARYRIENEAVDPTGWQERILARICQKLYRAMGAGDLEAAFHVFDTDASGFIEYTEFVTTLKRLDTGLSDQQVFALMRTADTNDDGRIDFHEFAHRFQVIFTAQTTTSSLDAPEEADAPLEPIEAVGARVRTHDVRPLDLETRHALVQIGQALFARGGSLHDHFYHLDTNHDGVLSRLEFQAALADLGFAFGQDVLDRVLAAVDRDGGHSIDYNEFVAAFRVEDVKARASGDLTWQHSVLHHVANVLYQHRVSLCHAFRLFDPAHRGVITRDEFRTGMQTLNAVLDAPLSDDQMDEVVAALDRHEDGGINYKDFLDSFRVVDVVGHVEEDDDDEAHDERQSKHGRACPPSGAGSRT